MGRLYWSVSSLPSREAIPVLQNELERAFSAEENRPYLGALAGERTPPGVVAARLGALSLLPPLFRHAGISPASVILRRDPQGRPYGTFRNGEPLPLDFNLSHSDGHGLCAILTGGGRVGADVEELLSPRRALPLINRYCTEGEKRLLAPVSETDKAMIFTRIWTVREAVGKQDGRGMPLRYDATAIPHGLSVPTGKIAASGTRLALCFPRGTRWDPCAGISSCGAVTWDTDE